ncbi:MAG: arginyltransferase [Gammaproteobacteria bacterium]|nr:arginyltransferase [Gammaproteobacteria bacterium]
MISIPLLLTEQHVCSYLDDELAQPAFVHPAFEMTQALYSRLIQQGFRRSGDEVYSPHCPNCSACIPVRLMVNQFQPNRSQKRCLQKNRNTYVTVMPAEFNQQHYDLYLRYQAHRHKDGSMQNSGPEEYIRFLKSTWCETRFMEFTINGELSAVAVVDVVENALSAVYTFFDPKFSAYSPGMYAVLWGIEWAKQQGLEFLYLGFWIKQCKKMSYKSNYQPLQQLKNKQWLFFNGDVNEKV